MADIILDEQPAQQEIILDEQPTLATSDASTQTTLTRAAVPAAQLPTVPPQTQSTESIGEALLRYGANAQAAMNLGFNRIGDTLQDIRYSQAGQELENVLSGQVNANPTSVPSLPEQAATAASDARKAELQQQLRTSDSQDSFGSTLAQGVGGAIPALAVGAAATALGPQVATTALGQAIIDGAVGFAAAEAAMAPKGERLGAAARGGALGAAMGPIGLIPGKGAIGELVRRGVAATGLGGVTLATGGTLQQAVTSGLLAAGLQGKVKTPVDRTLVAAPKAEVKLTEIPPAEGLPATDVQPTVRQTEISMVIDTARADQYAATAERQGAKVELTPIDEQNTAIRITKESEVSTSGQEVQTQERQVADTLQLKETPVGAKESESGLRVQNTEQAQAEGQVAYDAVLRSNTPPSVYDAIVELAQTGIVVRGKSRPVVDFTKQELINNPAWRAKAAEVLSNTDANYKTAVLEAENAIHSSKSQIGADARTTSAWADIRATEDAFLLGMQRDAVLRAKAAGKKLPEAVRADYEPELRNEPPTWIPPASSADALRIAQIASDKFMADRQLKAGKKFDKVRNAKRAIISQTLGPDAVIRELPLFKDNIELRRQWTYDGPQAIDAADISSTAKLVYDGLTSAQRSIVDEIAFAQRAREVAINKPSHIDPYTEGNPYVAEAMLSTLKERHNLTPEQEVMLTDRANQLHNIYRTQFLDKLLNTKSEMITLDEYAKLADKGAFYVPMSNRLTPDMRNWLDTFDPVLPEHLQQVGNAVGVRSSGLKTLEAGTDMPLNTDYAAMLHTGYVHLMSRIRRNEFLNELYDNISQPGSEILSESPAAGFSEVPFIKQGKVERLYIDNTIIEDVLKLNPLRLSFTSKIMRTLFSKNVKFWATGPGNPLFFVPDFPRNILSVSAMQDRIQPAYSPDPIVFSIQMARDLAATAKDAFTGKGAAEAMNRETHGMFSTLAGQYKLTDPLTKPSAPNKIVTALNYLNEVSQRWPYLAYRARLIRDGVKPEDASFMAHDMLNFSNGGNFIKTMDSTVTPFLNAGVQTVRGVWGSAAKHPARMAWRVSSTLTYLTLLDLAKRAYDDQYGEGRMSNNATNKWNLQKRIQVAVGPEYTNKNGGKSRLTTGVQVDALTGFLNTAANMLGGMAYNQLTGKPAPTPTREQLADAATNALLVAPSFEGQQLFRIMVGLTQNYDPFLHKAIYDGAEPMNPANQMTTPEQADDPLTNRTETGSAYRAALGNEAMQSLPEGLQLSPAKVQFVVESFLGHNDVYASSMALADKVVSLGGDTPAAKSRTWQEVLAASPTLGSVFGKTDSRYLYQDALRQSKQEIDITRNRQTADFVTLGWRWYKSRTDADFKEMANFVRNVQPVSDRQRFKDKLDAWTDIARQVKEPYNYNGKTYKPGDYIVQPDRVRTWFMIKDMPTKELKLNQFILLWENVAPADRPAIQQEAMYVFKGATPQAQQMRSAIKAVIAGRRPGKPTPASP